MTVRVGLVGTGHWARTVHAPSLTGLDGVELAGVWGRTPAARDELAGELGVRAFATPDDLFADVDVVDFAVAPAAQAELALAAARAGRGLLLEKPVALEAAQVTAIADALDATGAAGVVFMTRLFADVRAGWLAEQLGRDWTGAHAEWISAALSPGSPYAGSRWRYGTGLVWDLLPHVLSQLVPVLGPVEAVRLDGASADGVVEVSFRHAGGRLSEVRMTVSADRSRVAEWLEFTNGTTSARSPEAVIDYGAAHRHAVRTLLAGGPDAGDPLLAPSAVRASAALTAVMSTVAAALAAPASGSGRWMVPGEGVR
jgi:predicted dehydrogenase